VSYEEREQIDSYKAKDYAQGLERTMQATSRDQEKYATNAFAGNNASKFSEYGRQEVEGLGKKKSSGSSKNGEL